MIPTGNFVVLACICTGLESGSHYPLQQVHAGDQLPIKSFAVQLDTSPKFVGGGEAGGGRAPGPWRPQPAPASSAGGVISEQ
jgi:hypothetical protein